VDDIDVKKRFVKTICMSSNILYLILTNRTYGVDHVTEEPDSGVEEPVSGVEKRFVETICMSSNILYLILTNRTCGVDSLTEEPVSGVEKRFQKIIICMS
jgi:hypothetical protein